MYQPYNHMHKSTTIRQQRCATIELSTTFKGKKMKYLKYTAAFFAPMFIIYLLGSFTAASFDITQWDRDSRFSTAFVSLCASIGVLAHVLLNEDK